MDGMAKSLKSVGKVEKSWERAGGQPQGLVRWCPLWEHNRWTGDASELVLKVRRAARQRGE